MLTDLLRKIFFVAIAISTISCSFIQKTKFVLGSKKYLLTYSFVINMLISILFCKYFTDFNFAYSLWVGFFSFLGADTLFKTLEGKLDSYSERKNKDDLESS